MTRLPDDIGPAPDGQMGRLIQGVGEATDGLVLLVDVAALLDRLDAAGPSFDWAEKNQSASEDVSELGVPA